MSGVVAPGPLRRPGLPVAGLALVTPLVAACEGQPAVLFRFRHLVPVPPTIAIRVTGR